MSDDIKIRISVYYGDQVGSTYRQKVIKAEVVDKLIAKPGEFANLFEIVAYEAGQSTISALRETIEKRSITASDKFTADEKIAMVKEALCKIHPIMYVGVCLSSGTVVVHDVGVSGDETLFDCFIPETIPGFRVGPDVYPNIWALVRLRGELVTCKFRQGHEYYDEFIEAEACPVSFDEVKEALKKLPFPAELEVHESSPAPNIFKEGWTPMYE